MSTSHKKTKEFDSLAALRSQPAAVQEAQGYRDTLGEILQQPASWRETARLLAEPALRERLRRLLDPRPQQLVLTGSGSSLYVGECAAPALQEALGIGVQAIAAGSLLTHSAGLLPPGPGLLVSLARSGDSPESDAVVRQVLAQAPVYRHLIVTCNAQGRLATQYAGHPRAEVLLLDERTNDRSLVMTSSFTNLLLATAGLAPGQGTPEAVDVLADGVQRIFEEDADALAALARQDLGAVVYLGSGGALGAARESALKMLEMTGGQVRVAAETFLGLRHGPMSSLREDTVVVALLSGDARVRGYELDLLDELTRKRLGRRRVLVGSGLTNGGADGDTVHVALPALPAGEPALPAMAQVVAGQLLALFRCLAVGQRPDAPSQGVLTRVVGQFAIHGA